MDGITSPRLQSASTSLPCSDNAFWRSFPQENRRGKQVCRIPKITKIQEIHRWNFTPLGRSLCLSGGVFHLKNMTLRSLLWWSRSLKHFRFTVWAIRDDLCAHWKSIWWQCAECLPGLNKSAHNEEIWTYEADPFPLVWYFWLQNPSSLRCKPCCLWVGWVGGIFFSSVLTEEEQTATYEWPALLPAWRRVSVSRQVMRSSEICLAATQRIPVTCWFLSESWIHSPPLTPP